MKKLILLFAGLSLFVATGCDDDDTTTIEYPLVGLWQPVKEVVTTIPVGGSGVSDEITYTTCQKDSRWGFVEGNSGKRIDFDDSAITPGQCDMTFERNFTYSYDKSSKAIQIKYQGLVTPDKGKVTTLNETTLNLTIEDTTDPNEYHSVTYTFKRIIE